MDEKIISKQLFQTSCPKQMTFLGKRGVSGSLTKFLREKDTK